MRALNLNKAWLVYDRDIRAYVIGIVGLLLSVVVGPKLKLKNALMRWWCAEEPSMTRVQYTTR